MPFKTKRQKLAAAQRRFTFTDGGLVTYKESSSSKVEAKSISEEQGATVKTKGLEKRELISRSLEIENLGYVRAELVKILILASIIISSQIALSLV